MLADSFFLLADCSIEYNGRASSTLNRGVYAIIRKPDHSLQIHGNTKIRPLNYIGSGATMIVSPDEIVCSLRSESLKIRLYSILEVIPLDSLSCNGIILSRTESQLVDKLQSDQARYFGRTYKYSYREYPTKFGPIDLVLSDYEPIGGEAVCAVEVKRSKITVNAVVQLRKYAQDLPNTTELFVAAPKIATNATTYCSEHAITYIMVDF